MNSARYYISYIIRKIWLVFAVLTVTLALVITLLRYSLPYMDTQKAFIQDWLLETYGAEVEIGYISAIWKARGPAIVLKDLTLIHNDNSPIAFSVDETQVELDLISSLQSWQIHSKRFNLIGMDMHVDLEQLQQGGSNFPVVDALQTLFLEQLQRFSISDSDVTIKTRLDEQQIEVQQLSWLNKGTRHQGVGEMRVAELARNSARFVLDLTGSKNELEGTFYAKGEDLDLAPWVKEFVPTEYNLKKSRGNFELWAGLYNSQVTSVQANFSESSFLWQGKKKGSEVSANVLKGEFAAHPSGNGWLFNMRDFMLLVNDKALASNWAGEVTKSGVLTFNNIEPVKLSPILPLMNVLLGAEQAEPILSLAPSVQVDQVHFELSSKQVAAQLRFSDLHSNENEAIPGLQNLAGSISWLDNVMRVELNSAQSELKSGQLLGYNLPYETLRLDAFLDVSGDSLEVFAPEISIHGDKVNINTSLRYQSDSELFQLIGKLDDMSVAEAKALFPRNLMGPETTEYLRDNLHEGDVSGLQVIWSGQFSDFPFEQNQGVFQAGIELRNGRLEFDDSWPELSELNVDLLFENAGLMMTSRHARLLDVMVENVQANIPELAENAVLYIDAKGETTGTLATGVLQGSSLQDSVGAALDFVQVSGPLDLKLALTIPLTGVDVVADGEVTFKNNPVYIPDLDIQLVNTQGVLSFRNEKIVSNNLTALLLGQPMSMTVKGEQQEDAYKANISFAGDWDVAQLVQDYHPTLQPYLKGNTAWQGELALSLPEQGFHYSMQVHSQLQGIDLDIPEPFKKNADQERLLFLDSEGDATASTVRMLMGNAVKFNGIFPHADKQFSRAHLSIGDDNFVGMGLGFSVSAQLDSLSFTPWYHFIDALVSGLPDGDKPILEAPQRVFIETESMLFAGQKIRNVSVLAKNRTDDWLLDVNSEQARAKVAMSKQLFSQGMTVNADYINLAEWNNGLADTQGEPEMDYSKLPPFKFECKQCLLSGYELGKVKINMARNSSGMHIDLFELNKKDGKVVASGDWFIEGGSNSTWLKGTFTSNDMGSFLKDMDYDSGIRDSDAKMDFNLTWNQSPFDMDLNTINGDVKWHLGDGYLTEVSDQGARIFSILSLESLIRKLTLDFRDVFAKGFFYDKMDGTFQISDGRVTTRDTHIDGAAAAVNIEGYTDLSDKKLNYVVTVKPNLTSSLPVLLAWMVNPATAVAALALDEVITSANVVSNIKYSLTGTLSEPKVDLLDKASKSVELPAKKQAPVEPANGSFIPNPAIKSPQIGDSEVNKNGING